MFFFSHDENFGIRPSICWLYVWTISSPKDPQKKIFKIYQHVLLWGKFSVLPTLTFSQGMKTCFLAMKFLSWDHLYIYNMCAKFQGQKIYTKKRYSKPTNMCHYENDFFQSLGYNNSQKLLAALKIALINWEIKIMKWNFDTL